MLRETVTHPLGPVFDSRSQVLLLGTMPSPASRAGAFYYLHPQNRFWPVLAALFEGEPPVGNDARRSFALRHRIALWDVLAQCSIVGAGDPSIRDPVANDIAGLLQKAPIRAIFTTGQTAGWLYHRLCEPAAGIPAIVLPSPSPANCATRFETLVERYRVILPYLTER